MKNQLPIRYIWQNYTNFARRQTFKGKYDYTFTRETRRDI